MGIKKVITLTLFLLPFFLVAQTTFISTTTGAWSAPATWGGSGPPGNNDNVIITSGTNVTHSSNEDISRVTINSGGTLTSNARLRVFGAYINNGTHSGTGQVRMRAGNDTIMGSGLINTTSIFRVDAKRTILAGSNLTRNNQNTRCPNNDTLFNYGTYTTNRGITGNASSSFYNGATGTLNVQRALHNNGTVIASEAGNTINYNRTGGNNQNIKVTFDGYYNLIIDGNNINSDKRLAGATVVLNDFTINATTFRHLDTFTLYVGGDFNFISGDYQNDGGRLVFNGNSPQSITGDISANDVVINNSMGVAIASDTLRLGGYLTIPAGTFTSNDRLIVESNASREGAIGEIGSGALLDGDVVIQRYIDQGATNWRFMGSPTTNATFLDWRDDFIMAGFPGSQFPNFHFTSIYGYDESVGGHQDSGFFTISASDPITPGHGFWVFCGDSLNGTNPFTIDVTGPINQGQFNFNPSYTLSAGGLLEDGWNLVANPYPCPIDWDDPSWVKLNMDSAVYIWNTDANQYASYVTSGGASTNQGSNIIAAGQAFYVKANLPLPQLIIQEAAKYDTTALFLRQERLEDLIVRLTVDQGGDKAETLIRVVKKATDKMDGRFDAYHFKGIGDNKSVLYSSSDPQLSINSLPVESFKSIPIKAAGNKGSAKLRYNVDVLEGDFCLILTNSTTEEMHLLSDSGFIEVEFSENDVEVPYTLSIIRNTSGTTSYCDEVLNTPSIEADNIKMYYSNGSIHIQAGESLVGAYSIYNMEGKLVRTGTAQNGQIPLSDLSSGAYTFEFLESRLKFIHH